MELLRDNTGAQILDPDGNDLYMPYAGMVINTTLPALTLVMQRTGRSSDRIIFGNEDGDFDFSDSPAVQDLIDEYFTPPNDPVSGLPIAGGGAFDSANQLFGTQLTSTSTANTVSSPAPKFFRKNRLTIEPKMQVAMSGKVRTFIKTPVTREITLEWEPFEPTVYGLIGLLYFKTIRCVIGDDTYLLTLLDDAVKILHESRSTGRVVLNFRGRKLE